MEKSYEFTPKKSHPDTWGVEGDTNVYGQQETSEGALSAENIAGVTLDKNVRDEIEVALDKATFLPSDLELVDAGELARLFLELNQNNVIISTEPSAPKLAERKRIISELVGLVRQAVEG